MESRNITLTICGEWLDFSPRDRKAVCEIDDLFKLTGNIPLVSYPLYNLIPEIISDEIWNAHLSVSWRIYEMQMLEMGTGLCRKLS